MPIFCSQCGAQNHDAATFCTTCGNTPVSGARSNLPADPFPFAGGESSSAAASPAYYPGRQSQESYQQPGAPLSGYVAPTNATQKSKLAAGLLGIFLGTMGIHRFYLGYTGIGITQLLLGLGGWFTCGITTLIAWVWGIIDGIMILTGAISKDAEGRPLNP